MHNTQIKEIKDLLYEVGVFRYEPYDFMCEAENQKEN